VSHNGEDVVMSMVVPEFHLLDVERELSVAHSVEFHDPLFSVTPETFEAVDIDSAPGELFTMIDSQVTIAAEHESVIDLVLIGIDDAPAFDLFDCQPENGSGTDIGNNFHVNMSIPLKDPENRDFSGCPASSDALSMASEVSFVQLDFTTEENIRVLSMSQDRHPDRIDSLQSRIVGNVKLAGNLAARYLQFKELDDPQPLAACQGPPVDPAAAKVVKGVSAS